MGAFQAVASGLGETGEQVGQGLNQALNEALKVRSQLHGEQMDTAHLSLAQAALAQQGHLAELSHDLTRLQIMQNNQEDLGVTLDPKTGQYARNFRDKTTNQIRQLPLAPGSVPPDSPQGQMAYYQTLISQKRDDGTPMFSDTQAKQIAFKMPQAYRTDPAGVMTGFQELVRSDPYNLTGQEAIKKAEQLYAEYVGRGGYFRWANGGLGNSKDLTGFTAGEKRQYDAEVSPLKLQEQMLQSVMRSEMGTAITPQQSEAISQKYLPALMQLYSQEQEIINNIKGKRSGGNVGQMPDVSGLMKMIGIKPPASGTTSPAAEAGMVDVISPEGVPGQIPKANLQKALAQGYKQAP
jgi:hypothetical protein